MYIDVPRYIYNKEKGNDPVRPCRRFKKFPLTRRLFQHLFNDSMHRSSHLYGIYTCIHSHIYTLSSSFFFSPENHFVGESTLNTLLFSRRTHTHTKSVVRQMRKTNEQLKKKMKFSNGLLLYVYIGIHSISEIKEQKKIQERIAPNKEKPLWVIEIMQSNKPTRSNWYYAISDNTKLLCNKCKN